jgi:hypothetical protein
MMTRTKKKRKLKKRTGIKPLRLWRQTGTGL